MLSSVLTMLLALFASTVSAQDNQGPIQFDSIHNFTTIYGTWSSGSKHVVTGPNFANPANMTFVYPKTTGVSYSFSNDGYYEIARYRFNSNGSEPTCITGVIGWVHGSYTINPNGSITMAALADGFQQVQDPCAAQSNFIEPYTQTEYYQSWRIFKDPAAGFKLHMFSFDGSPVVPMAQLYSTPQMHPTRLLRNVSADGGQLGGLATSGAEELCPTLVSAVLGAAGLAILVTTTLL